MVVSWEISGGIFLKISRKITDFPENLRRKNSGNFWPSIL